MRLTQTYADMLEMVRNHYKFGSVPLEARVMVLEELVEMLCIKLDDIQQRSSNDGK